MKGLKRANMSISPSIYTIIALAVIFICNVYRFTLLHSIEFKASHNIFKSIRKIHSTGTKGKGVTLLRPHQDLPPTCGPNKGIVGVGYVNRLRYLLLVVVEVGVAVLISVNTGPQAVADSPGPSLRHSKDT